MASVVIDKLLATVIQLKASDLHITVGQPPVVRHHGKMKRLDTKVLESDDTVGLMKSITPDRCQQELQEKGGCDFRRSSYWTVTGSASPSSGSGNIGMVLRRIPSSFLSFEQIGMPETIDGLSPGRAGLLLVTGPTGSGKTTSLASMMNFLNQNYDKHIITLEDPIEYYHQHQKCTVNQREIGVDVPSFKEGIRRALRMDPDIILVGEMRDLETITRSHRGCRKPAVVFGIAAHQQCLQHDQPYYRRVLEGTAGPDSHAAVDRAHRCAIAVPHARRSRKVWLQLTRC